MEGISTSKCHCHEEVRLQKIPEIMLAIWYKSGNLWIYIKRARKLKISAGKVYVKSYLLPYAETTKQKTKLLERSANPEFDANLIVRIKV